MVSEGRPVQLWGLRADDYGEAQTSQRTGEGKSHVVEAFAI